MNTVFVGLAISLAYGVVGAGILFPLEGGAETYNFWEAYVSTFRSLFSLGLILGTALVVHRTQALIPERIEASFTEEQLAATTYSTYRDRYVSRRRSVTFAAEFVVAAFVIFSLCQLPLGSIAEALLMIAVCAEYAFGVYVGRKLCYAGMMLHALLEIRVTRNLFAGHELDEINTHVNVVSMLTLVFVYVHVRNYYDAPFAYQSFMGASARVLLILPAIIATPVLLIFNFYPRSALRRIYSQSIDVAVRRLREKLKREDLSAYEQKACVIEFDKLARDELRYRLRLTLSDLPIGIAVVVMVLDPLLG